MTTGEDKRTRERWDLILYFNRQQRAVARSQIRIARPGPAVWSTLLLYILNCCLSFLYYFGHRNGLEMYCTTFLSNRHSYAEDQRCNINRVWWCWYQNKRGGSKRSLKQIRYRDQLCFQKEDHNVLASAIPLRQENAFVYFRIKDAGWCEWSLNLTLICHQLLTDIVVAIIHSLGPLLFTPCSLRNGPFAYLIPFTQYIPLTAIYRLSIHHDLSCRRKLRS